LVVINLQKTPVDLYASLIINGKIDDVIDLLMKKLKLKIPQFNLSRWTEVKIEESK
jgi:hypothetical protein